MNNSKTPEVLKFQTEYQKIIGKLVKMGVPITIVLIITMLIAGQNTDDNYLRINIPQMLTGKSVLMDSRGLTQTNDHNFLNKDLAIFSDGTTFTGISYVSADGKYTNIEPEMSEYPNVYQIDDKRALVMAYNPEMKEYSIYLFTRGEYPNYTIVNFGTLHGFSANSRMDFLEQEGKKSLLIAGIIGKLNGLYSIELVENALEPQLIIDDRIGTFASNNSGDLYYISNHIDGSQYIVYGLIKNGQFEEVKRKTLDDKMYSHNVLTYGIEVTEGGDLKLLYDEGLKQTLDDIRIRTFNRNLEENIGSTLTEINGGDSEMTSNEPFITNP